jgi:isoleucyl-tRNA synthetase
MGLISKEIQGFTTEQINQLGERKSRNCYRNTVNLSIEDVEITSQDIEGWLVANANGITVALDIINIRN